MRFLEAKDTQALNGKQTEVILLTDVADEEELQFRWLPTEMLSIAMRYSSQGRVSEQELQTRAVRHSRSP